MSTVSSTNSSSSSKSATNALSSAGLATTFTADDFMKLLIEQMKNQDPLNPTDSTQYMSQLAQFSSLTQLTELNSSMTTSINANYALAQSVSNTMSSSLIGKDVKISGDSIVVNNQSGITLDINTPGYAESAKLSIYNSDGNLVKTINESDLAQGDHKITWDCKNDSGSTVSNGTYTYKLEATSSSGATLDASCYVYGTVTAIRFTSSGAELVVGGSAYSSSDVYEVVNNSTN